MYMSTLSPIIVICYFFNVSATTEIYTLSLHDALPISARLHARESDSNPHLRAGRSPVSRMARSGYGCPHQDRKSTRLNSSHQIISYAVFCLKKKKKYK